MIHKLDADTPGSVRVTFSLTGKILAEQIMLVGDFNDWDARATPMHHDGPEADWVVTLEVAPGRSYRFRYLVDGTQWLNDWHADDFLENPYGSFDSVLDLRIKDLRP